MQKSFTKRASALALAAAMTLTLASAPVSSVNAASKSVQVITQATYNDGETVKYTYNKKGLVTKAVSKSSYKTNGDDYEGAKDVAVTKTTTYKYNKKNKIATETTKTVTKTTYYQMDKSTGLKVAANKGTVTDTTTSVTKYTYNKKGLATQSVKTTTSSMSGSLTTTSKSAGFSATEMSDGKLLAGYNTYKPDGTEYDENTKDNAYYYNGDFSIGEGTQTVTTTYTPSASGYTAKSTTTTTETGVKKDSVKQYYGRDKSGDTEVIIPLTLVETPNEYTYYVNGKEHKGTTISTSYKKADGTDFYGDTFSIVSSVNVTADPTVSTSSTVTSQDDYSGKAVTTTKYTYDKKKRVKKAVATTVNSSSTTSTTSDVSKTTGKHYYYTDSTFVSNSEENTKSEETSEVTATTTTTYTYDKKGRAKKTVYTDPGTVNGKSTESSMVTSSKYDQTVTLSDGTVANTSTESYTNSAYPSTKTTVSENGVETITNTKNSYVHTYESTDNDNKSSGTKEYTYYGNGGSKIVDNYNETRVYRKADDSVYSTEVNVGTETRYTFDEKGKSTGYVETWKSTETYADGTVETSENASSYYNDGVNPSDTGTLAMTKMAAPIAANEASGTSYSKSESNNVFAVPSKITTTYKYDKKGNVSSAKATGTTSEVKDVKNETYGNNIYEFDSLGKTKAKKAVVTHKFTNKNTMENTIKAGTKVLTKKLSMAKSTYDRSTSSGYSLTGRVLYKLKGKKSSQASLAEKQQWIIQNGRLNGQVGL